jgi:DNA-binding LacI/PurR family transcriptional regulator
MMALGAMDAARYDHALIIPHDVSIVGFDGAAQGRWPSYDLVTVRQPAREMVEAAADMLMARIEDPALSIEKRSFTGEFIHGTSARLG